MAEARVIPASPLWEKVLGGAGISKEKFVGHMFKYAVFDIKPTYKDQFFIPDVQQHSTKFCLGGGARRYYFT